MGDNYINTQALGTFFASGADGPATTALNLLNSMTPLFYNLQTGDPVPYYGAIRPNQLETLSATQPLYGPLGYPQVIGTSSATGLDVWAHLALVTQAIKDIIANLPIITGQVLTNGSGTASIDISGHGFGLNQPTVILQPINFFTANPNPIVASIQFINSATLDIITQEIVGGVVSPVGAWVQYYLFPSAVPV